MIRLANLLATLHIFQFMVPASQEPNEGMYILYGAKDRERYNYPEDTITFDRLRESQREVDLLKQRVSILERLMLE